MTRFALNPFPEFLGLAALSLACSGQPDTIGSGGPPAGSSDGPRQSFDPTQPGASLLCNSEEYGPSFWVLSAMNHKLEQYPELASAIGLARVTDCESANRFFAGYSAYAAEHVDFDANEPEPPRSDVEPALPSTPPPSVEDVPKIAGGEEGIVNNPVVQIRFKACASVDSSVPSTCPNADDSWILKQPGEPDVDLRKLTSKCSATFIAKNWLLTAAHCITWVAIDSCMEHRDTFDDCKPTYDTWGLWQIIGTRPNQTKISNVLVWARAYVFGSWFGKPMADNPVLCKTPGCGNLDLVANDDLALLYVPPEFDESLTPDIEPDGAKRISAETPEAAWNLAFYGWGRPTPTSDDILRRGRNFFDVFTVHDRRIDVEATTPRPVPCPGDSGGPMVRTGMELDTNAGIKQGLEAVVGVTSWANAPCPKNPPATTMKGKWASTRVDQFDHMKFIRDTIHRYPAWRNFDCKARGLVGLEAWECWGAPCTSDSCAITQTCVGSGREYAVEHKKFSCANCAGTPQQGSCDCMIGQCLSN